MNTQAKASNQKLKIGLLCIIVVLVVGVSLVVLSRRRAERAANEAAQRDLINAVVACGGNVQEQLNAAKSLHEQHPDMTYAEVYKLLTVSVEIKCQ
ncbi:MAG: hypothetical protein M3R15_04635 [Acidobacteriota bacterium]|nr:hypothetical protein [Acidobacteriota bacterium]